jgi:hypothetical protein
MDGLIHHIGYTAGLADPSGEASVALHAALPGIRNRLERLLVRRDTQQIQLFGLGTQQALGQGGTDAVVRFLHRYFPVASVFEQGDSENLDTAS